MMLVAILASALAQPVPLDQAARCHLISEMANRAYAQAEKAGGVPEGDLPYVEPFRRLGIAARDAFGAAMIREDKDAKDVPALMDSAVERIAESGGSEHTARECWALFGIEAPR